MKKGLILILLFVFVSGVSGCERNSGSVDSPSSDKIEISKNIGGITAKLIIKPGAERIAVGKPISVAVDILNKQDRDISGTYFLSDTPSDSFGGIPGQITNSFRAAAGEDRNTIKGSISFDYNGDTSWFGYFCFYDFINSELLPEIDIDTFKKYKEYS